jgi:hypothetical protein
MELARGDGWWGRRRERGGRRSCRVTRGARERERELARVRGKELKKNSRIACIIYISYAWAAYINSWPIM